MTASNRSSDVVIAGGGLAGLTAAVYLGRAGKRVALYEKAVELGGRARTQVKSEYRFNIGPHALYKEGHGVRVLRELGILPSGGTPGVSGAYAVRAGSKHALPGGFVSLLSTGLLGLAAKLEVARLLGSFRRIDASRWHHTSVGDWLDGNLRHAEVRELIQALFRLSTYTNDPQHQTASVAIAQLQLALSGNVLYLDGGWQTMVDNLRAAAVAAGVEIHSGLRVEAVLHQQRVSGIELSDGTQHAAATVVLAMPPADAAALVRGSAALRAWNDNNQAIAAACLDVALSRLPNPLAGFALGIDRPLYFSVHSNAAQLAPSGGAVVHVAKYLDPNQANDPQADQHELEELFDRLQPGWRELVVERRFLPSMTVYNGAVTASRGGLATRPGPVVPGIDGLYVAGDWVGNAGFLADASFASAHQVATRLTQNGTAAARAA